MHLVDRPFGPGDLVVDDDGYEHRVVAVWIDEAINEASSDPETIFSVSVRPIDTSTGQTIELQDDELTLIKRA